MLSREAIERFRQMPLTERLSLVMPMIAEETPHLLAGPPEVARRRFEVLRRENDLRNAGILAGLAQAKAHDAAREQGR